MDIIRSIDNSLPTAVKLISAEHCTPSKLLYLPTVDCTCVWPFRVIQQNLVFINRKPIHDFLAVRSRTLSGIASRSLKPPHHITEPPIKGYTSNFVVKQRPKSWHIYLIFTENCDLQSFCHNTLDSQTDDDRTSYDSGRTYNAVATYS